MRDLVSLSTVGRLLYTGAAAFAAASCFAQAPASGRIPTVTRLVRVMTTLETDLDARIRAGDRPAVEQMLSDEFEVREGANPGTPVPREDWLRDALARPPSERSIEQMSVHEFGELAIASFLEQRAAPSDRLPAVYRVDVWKRNGERWSLARRFESRFAQSPPARPREPVIPKKY